MEKNREIQNAIENLITNQLEPIENKIQELSKKADKTEKHVEKLTEDIQSIKKVENSVKELEESLNDYRQTIVQTISDQFDKKLQKVSADFDNSQKVFMDSISERIQSEVHKTLVGLIVLAVPVIAGIVKFFFF